MKSPPDISPSLTQAGQLDTPAVIGPALPPGTEPWVWAVLRSHLDQPLGSMIAALSDEEARYMMTFIERG